MKLIPDWRRAWKFMSVQLAAALGVLSAAYEYLPAVQSHFSDGWVKWFALAIIGARLIQQQKVRDNDSGT